MVKKVKTVQELLQERSDMLAQREAINIQMNEIADKANAEKRELSAEENTKYQQLQSNFQKIGREIAMNVDAVNYAQSNKVGEKSKNQLLREFFAGVRSGNGKTDVILQRETPLKTTGLEAGGMIPLTIQDIIPCDEMGLIYDKVGVKIATGVVGNIQWPYMGAFEAEIPGETVALNDTDVTLSKIAAKHVRLGLTVAIANQAIMDSNVDLENLIKDDMRMAIKRTLNRVMFSHENFKSDLHGPFAAAKATGNFKAAVPTYAELIAMKGKVAAEGVDMAGFCYVMSESMKATLEATPMDAGSGRMIIENGAIGGYPVFCTEFINYGAEKRKAAEEYIGAGVWEYLALNQHGDARLVIDPYSQAKKDLIQITLNADWSMTTLKTQAFALYKNTVL